MSKKEGGIRMIDKTAIPEEVGFKERLFINFGNLCMLGKGKALEIDLQELGLTRQGLLYIVKQWNEQKHLGPLLQKGGVLGTIGRWRRLGFTVKNQETHPIAYVYAIEKEEEAPKE